MSILPSGSQENHLLQAALGYADRGWRAFPLYWIVDGACSCGKDCGTNAGKHPRTYHGLKDATTNERTIRAWWDQWPLANVGIATGPVSGFFMLGPDGQAGIDALAELERQHGPLPPTPRLRSGGGGRHYYFAWPHGGGIKNSRNHNGLPIDVRGDGGYVVAPPTRHASGNLYTWEVPPDEIEPAEAPPWLVDWIKNGKGTTRKRKTRDEGTNLTNQTQQTPRRPAGGEVDSFSSFNSSARQPPAQGQVVFTVRPDVGQDAQARAVAYLAKCPPAISGQGGHNQAFEVARAIVYGFDLGREAGYDLLAQHYNPRCEPPWSEAELRHKCEDADAKPFDKPRGYLLQGDQQPEPAGDARVNDDGAEEIEALPMPPPAPWPTLPPEALHGLAGSIVRMIAPETESHPVAILGQLLVAFGNAVGRGPHFKVEGDSHHTNLFLCLVGQSSHGRKGTSRGRVMQLMSHADDHWCQNCRAQGLSSGEGLIWAIRDPIEKKEPIKERGRVTGYQTVLADEGVSDKRLLADESEFAQVLKVLQREGNSLSPVIRHSWETVQLRTLTKNSPARATGAHVSISAHITGPELARHLKDTEAFNGFANRFLWLCVRRSQYLPDGGRDLDVSRLGTSLNFALAGARNHGAMTRSQAAGTLWRAEYPRLTAGRGGLYGAVTGRAAAQVLRLSMLYALFDGRDVIDEEHLRAALALWSYADASARLIFGVEPEDPLIGLVLARLQEAGPAGMTRTDLHNALSRNIPARNLLEALAKLRDRGDAYAERVKTGKPGAPAERWYARRRNELNESNESNPSAAAVSSFNSFNSFLRSPSGDGEEVVTV
jgi:hypothetical protein